MPIANSKQLRAAHNKLSRAAAQSRRQAQDAQSESDLRAKYAAEGKSSSRESLGARIASNFK